jgi:hypothetical protein
MNYPLLHQSPPNVNLSKIPVSFPGRRQFPVYINPMVHLSLDTNYNASITSPYLHLRLKYLGSHLSRHEWGKAASPLHILASGLAPQL